MFVMWLLLLFVFQEVIMTWYLLPHWVGVALQAYTLLRFVHDISIVGCLTQL
jgi:hypothetical protein